MAKRTKAKKVTKAKVRRITPKKVEKGQLESPFQFQGAKEPLLGKYCNVALIRHSKNEFVLDFILNIQNENMLVSRVLTNPEHAKKIYKALGQNIKKYEAIFDKIKVE